MEEAEEEALRLALEASLQIAEAEGKGGEEVKREEGKERLEEGGGPLESQRGQ